MPARSYSLVLDGETLSVEVINACLAHKNIKIKIPAKTIQKVSASNQFLMEASEKTVIYGVNTGFGPMASYVISKDSLKTLQKNLIRSHATGVGEPIEDDFVLAAMIIRLNTLLKGNSGVNISVINALAKMIEKRVIPVVPEHGAVGTSGDLIQLAHIALAVMGEGECKMRGNRMSTREAFRRANIKPCTLGPKDGLALINGTSVMTAIAAVLAANAERLLVSEIVHSAAALDIIGGYDDSIDPALHAVRPHPGQVAVARTIRELLHDSRSLTSREKVARTTRITSSTYELPEMIQNVYSFRCVPQILGPLYDTIECVKRVINIEINATTDNPIVVHKERRFLHGGNFHGDYIATAVDQLKIPVVKLSLLAERRVNYFLDESLNKHFPPFLNKKTPGLTLALQGLQFVATSTAADNQSLAFPHSLHSISTNASNQDVVSMGTDAALLLAKVIENTAYILAIEAVVLAQAYELLPKQKRHLLARSTHHFYKEIRQQSASVEEDRPLGKEIEAIAASYRSNYGHVKI